MPKLKKRADGRYVKTFVDPDTGKRISFYGQSEREINRKILEHQTKKEAGRTFREVAEEWWEQAEPELAVQSVSGYRVSMRRAVDFFGDSYIGDITVPQLVRYLDTLGKQGLSQKTVAKARMVCNLIFKHAFLRGEIDTNRCADIPLPKGLSKTVRKAASAEDENIIRSLADDEWLVPFIALMTGMRKGEILALQWKDIDFEKNTISVTKSVAHDNNRPFIKEPKTEESVRKVPLLNSLKERLLSVPDRHPEHYLISLTDGKSPISETQYQRAYARFKERAGITATAHVLRHSFATVADESGVRPKSIQHILGHKQLSTTLNTYTEFREKQLADAADILNEMEAKKPTSSQ